MRILVCFMLVLALGGCATAINTDYIARMNSMVGVSEKTLVARMGVPDKSYAVDHIHKAVAYTTVNERYVDGGGGIGFCGGTFGGGIGYSACHNDFPRRIVNETCEVTFLIAGNVVKAWQQRGNGCPRIQ